MSSITVYVFHFSDDGKVTRIPYAKWKRITHGDELVEEFSSLPVLIAYAYILLEDRKPDYCPRIEGEICYFDHSGKFISEVPYFDLLQDTDEESGGVVSLEHRKKKKSFFEKYYWELNAQQIQAVIDCIWKYGN